METTELDIAWAAGLFEGEGCISTMSPRSGGRRYGPYARLGLAMNDEDVVRRFAAIVGVGTVNQHRLCTWHCGKAADVLQVLRLFEPYFGSRRRARAAEIVELAEVTETSVHHNLLKTHCPMGHAYVDSNLYLDKRGKRNCRKCRQRHSANYYARKKVESLGLIQ